MYYTLVVEMVAHIRSRQEDLKTLLCNLRNTDVHTSRKLTPANLFTGLGSDEAIDALIRAFCRPGKDKILTCPPTYGMYAVSAHVNDVEVVHVPLDVNDGFRLQADLINAKLADDPTIKLVYICSPGNPTANTQSKEDVEAVLKHPSWNGVVIVDEAYVDFAPDEADLAQLATEWPNLAVMQTLSKAFGLAGIRLGVAFTSPEVARLLNNLKAPYNIPEPTSQIAIRAMQKEGLAVMKKHKMQIIQQRERLVTEMPKIPGVGSFKGGQDSNFLLVEMLDKPGGKPSNETALAVYERLAQTKGVVVRFRGKELGCVGCLRVTVGTEQETSKFLQSLETVLKDIFSGKQQTGVREEETKEKDANGVIA